MYTSPLPTPHSLSSIYTENDHFRIHTLKIKHVLCFIQPRNIAVNQVLRKTDWSSHISLGVFALSVSHQTVRLIKVDGGVTDALFRSARHMSTLVTSTRRPPPSSCTVVSHAVCGAQIQGGVVQHGTTTPGQGPRALSGAGPRRGPSSRFSVIGGVAGQGVTGEGHQFVSTQVGETVTRLQLRGQRPDPRPPTVVCLGQGGVAVPGWCAAAGATTTTSSIPFTFKEENRCDLNNQHFYIFNR